VNNHRGRKFSVRPVVRPTTVYDLSWIAPLVSSHVVSRYLPRYRGYRTTLCNDRQSTLSDSSVNIS